MDLTGLLLRAGAARPHVLVAVMPGGTAVRLAAEEQLRRRGWPAALTPADADVLLVAGAPAADIAAAVEAAWAAIPAPRARVQVIQAGEVAAALDAAQSELTTGAARQPPSEGSHGAVGGRPDDHGMGDMDMQMDMGHTDMDHMDMDMDMGTPAGLPLARRAEDRDGLKLDQLHVPLGPILADWPAGLVVRLMLQGDVVQRAETGAMGLAADGGSFWTEPWRGAAAGEPVTTGAGARRRAAAHLDSLGRLLAVAGWDAAATAAFRLRDETLGDTPVSALGPAVRRLTARVARSRVLAWSTRGIGTVRPADLADAGAGGLQLRIGGDVTDRYRRWCVEVTDLTAAFDDGSSLDSRVLEAPRGALDGARAPSAALLAVLPGLLAGAELAAARLIVASLDPDLDELSAPVAAGHDR